MKPWFQKRDPVAHEVFPADREDLLDAYKDGRKDELQRVKAAPIAAHSEKAEVKAAYERGRRDERARRRGSPIPALLVIIVALAGAGALYLAVREGSFTKGGEVIDRNVTAASETVQAPVRNAADNAGDALQNAGENLKETAGSKR